jgi:hypothetical protein
VQVVREKHVKTTNGEKGSRFLDVAAVDRTTGQVIDFVQVGRETKAGNPVAREQRAINDIRSASPKTDVSFHPYNR